MKIKDISTSHKVFHVSANKFDNFMDDKYGIGLWFSDSSDEARIAADIKEDDAILYTAMITIRKPYKTKDDPSKQMVDKLKSEGYDGIILPSVGGFSKDFVVFDTKQIKILNIRRWKDET